MSRGKGRLIVISAPSGAGKSTVISCMLKLRPELVLSVSATTRAPRAGEIDGVAYRFISREQFLKMVDNGEFIEYAEYVGEYYWTPSKSVNDHLASGDDVLLEIEVQGARQIMELAPDAVTLFIIPPDMEELERRLRGRATDSEEKLAARLDRARTELMEKDRYKHIVVNDKVSRAAKEILSIIDSYDEMRNK